MGNDAPFERPSKSAEEAEGLFKNSMDEVNEVFAEPKVRNVFISFANEDQFMIDLLRSQGKNPDLDFRFRDYSVKEHIDEKWKTHVREKLDQVSVTIVGISEHSAESEPVNWEIEESYRQGKKVIGVRLHSSRNDPIPPALISHNAKIIDWTVAGINQALQED